MSNLLRIDLFTFEAEDRRAGHDSQLGKLGKISDDALRNTVRKVFSVRIVGCVHERYHSERLDFWRRSDCLSRPPDVNKGRGGNCQQERREADYHATLMHPYLVDDVFRTRSGCDGGSSARYFIRMPTRSRNSELVRRCDAFNAGLQIQRLFKSPQINQEIFARLVTL